MHIADLLDPLDLDEAIETGFVREQTSPDGLRILNYTEQAVYSRTWTPATLHCRGIILDGSGEILARPWRKFFNYGELPDGSLDLTAPVEVTDKADGSLGILHRDTFGQPRIATRGSFRSEQAQHATDIYLSRYWDAWSPDASATYLFEIVFPANRIVLDYGQFDDLILLGAVDIESGRYYGPNDAICAGWPGPRAGVFDFPTLADALAAEPRPNAEGLVARYLSGAHEGTMVKIKQTDYVALHRIMTGLTARRLWERAAVFACLATDPGIAPRRLAQVLHMDVVDVQGIIDAGPDWADEVRKTAPEEFTAWIDETLGRLDDQAEEIIAIVQGEAFGWAGVDRKTIAQGIADHPYRGMVFAAIDGRDITASAWAEIRPAAEKPFAARSEDVA